MGPYTCEGLIFFLQTMFPSVLLLLALFGCASAQQHGFGPNSAACTCVPYYQCTDGSLITDGAGIIGIRSDQCSNFLDVCCGNPDVAITPSPGPDSQYNSQCGRRNPTGVNARVTGLQGTQAQFGEFPWMAAILQTEVVGEEEVSLYVCGGSLIKPNVVLTGAHCVQSWVHQPNTLKVRLGEWDTQQTYELYTHVNARVSQVIIHEEFNAGSLSNDYAILILETPVELSPHIDTICLADQNTAYNKASCIVTGWGKDQFGKPGEFQNILKKITLPLVSYDQCQSALRTTRLGLAFNLHHTFNCAGGELNGNDACKGDGGSPLVCPLSDDPKTYVQVGMVAWGIECGLPGIPGVYVNVPAGINWINERI